VGHVPAELAQRWREAERRLYPVILSDPEAYRRYVLAVRELADELRSVAASTALAEAYRDADRRAAAVLERSGAPVAAHVTEVVAGAAFALRHRELAAEEAAAEVVRRLAEAAASGAEWVVVHEAGRPELAVLGQYRRLEMRLRDGAGLHSFVEMGAGADRPVFVVEVLALDPATGARRGGGQGRVELADQDAWMRALEELRGGPEGGRVDTPEGSREYAITVDKRFL
jgi:hypothetical protein